MLRMVSFDWYCSLLKEFLCRQPPVSLPTSVVTSSRWLGKKIKSRKTILKFKNNVDLIMSNNFSIGANLVGPSVWPPLAPHVLVTWQKKLHDYGRVGTHFVGIFKLNTIIIRK